MHSLPKKKTSDASSPASTRIGTALEKEVAYDFIFCGTGAAACLLLLELSAAELLDGKRVLLIDPEEKTTRDKTFCFWAAEEEPVAEALRDIVSREWTKTELPGPRLAELAPLTYYHVSSIDLYQKTRSLTSSGNFTRLLQRADQISADEKGTWVLAGGQVYYGHHIFDSRTPVFEAPQTGRNHLCQSFIGWIIETQKAITHPEAFRFMDFEIDQQGFTQFVYVLPYSGNKALAEVTRFGTEPINEEEASQLLNGYLTRHFGEFRLLETERGRIPMSNCRIENKPVPGVTWLGARNYQIKPSTGYAFKNMYYEARRIASDLATGTEPERGNKTHEIASRGRFAFYDGLLLDILENRPGEGKRIFSDLLKKTRIETLLKFLEEKTSLSEDISIFISLPWAPFLKALYRKMAKSAWLRPAALLVLSLLLLLPGAGSAAQQIIGYGLFLVGLALVGIPHGAVDHLLESGHMDLTTTAGFAIRYLSMAGLAGFLFLIAPTLSLLLFLGYSAWHFGQADGRQWGLGPVGSLFWGTSVLVFILSTHMEETNRVVESMGSLPWTFSGPCPPWAMLGWVIPALIRRSLPLAFTAIWLVLSAFLPLILAFGLYFIGQHSLTGWQHIKSHLNMSDRTIWLRAFPFHAGAWALLLLFFLLSNDPVKPEGESIWGIFFIFIACISLPHTLAMNAMYRKPGF
jgi:lycopene beta-cyclase